MFASYPIAARGALLAFLAALGLGVASPAKAQVVISQVYGGGGNNGSLYRNDFVELFNRGAAPVNVTGWSLQFTNATATNAWTVTALSGTIQPGAYYLIQQAAGTGGTVDLPTPDATGTAAMGATSGNAILLSANTQLPTGCPAGGNGAVIDRVGYGATAICGETAPTAAPSNTTSVGRGSNGCTDSGNNSSDFTVSAGSNTFVPRNSSSALNPCGPVGTSLSVNDVAAIETDAGTTTFSFTVSLSAPAGAGGVTFDIATADGTGTLADNDYVQRALTGQTIATGNSSYTFDVSVNGDLTNEPNETFFVNVTNVTGATVADGQGQGTINNDDAPLTPIHAIQGNGAASPLLGNAVVTRGVVTVRVNNGFYFQTPDADADADPNTSQGMFAFTSSAPPAGAAVGNLVQVAGTVAEFVPPTDLNQQPLTQLTSPTTTVIATGQPLPAPVTLTTVLPDPAGGIEQLERLENMRVTAPSFTITGATGGSISEPNATSTTNGRFYGVVAGTPRPFRETGLEPEDAVGQPATIPRWDGNPERINFESLRARNAAGTLRTAINVDAGQGVSGLTGVIDYAFRNWRFTIDFDAVAVVTGSATAGAVSAATPAEYTVASYNLQRFFDDNNDPALSEPVLTPAAFANRLAKASRGIREFLRAPDIIGIVEIEDLATLQALATRINADAVAANEPDPQYQAYLSNGTDPGGIDVGFLVKAAPVVGSTPRVAVNSVTQFGLNTLLKCPDGSDNVTGERLNDRPPLLLDAVVAAPNGASAPVVVIVNHSRSLGSATSTAAPPVGPCPVVNFATEGDRVRRKRQQQAEFLADLVQARQVANPNENLVVVGDFNAFEFNDGLGDSIGTISGTPAPDNETVVPGDGIDLVNPNLGNLIAGVAALQRYSYVFDGDAQNLDHALVNAAIAASAAPVRLEHARINADFAEDNRGDTTVPLRLSDHDPAVAYFTGPGFGLPDAVFSNGFEDPPPP